MRRRITLYIGGSRADLQEDGLVLLNYAATELTNPAVVRNAWTQTVELPRTSANDAIFGASFRLDRNAGIGGEAGVEFSAGRKTPFAIYTEAGLVLFSGYAKLDAVTRDAYKVTLYGGLGDFIYGLSYDENGNKRTLADLDYGVDLDFTISSRAVHDAWEMLKTGSILIAPDEVHTKSILDSNGNLTATTNAYRYVNEYGVIAGGKYLISGWQASSTKVAAALDKDGNILQTWTSATSGVAVVDEQVTMPANTTTLLLSGWTSSTRQDAFLKHIDPRWDIINFAPCYNGIPTDFSADKAVALPADIQIPSSKTDGGTTYDTALGGGYCVVNLPKEADEWATRDLRSYLQRPVLSVRKLLAAIANSANNGGWSVDLSDIVGVKQLDSWLTRPLLPSLGTYNQKGGITPTFSSTPSSGAELAQITLADVPSGAEVTVSGKFRLSVLFGTTPGSNSLGSVWYNSGSDEYRNGVWFAQMVAYASDNTKIAVSDVYAVKNDIYSTNIQTIAANCGYTPQAIAGQTPNYVLALGQVQFNKDANGRYVGDTRLTGAQGLQDIPLSVTATGIAYVKIFVSRYVIDATSGAYIGTGLNLSGYAESNASLVSLGVTATSTGSNIRSGATITKEMLLNTKGTPADYLLALCKACGLYILADGAAKTVQILTRDSFFEDVTEDLTKRIDKGSVEITPLAFDKRWYEWKHDAVGGAFEKQYQETEGVKYGIQRVDTNYAFDADTKDVLSGGVLRSCAAVRAGGRFWCYMEDTFTTYTPGLLIYGDASQTLWDASGNGKDFGIDAVTTNIVIEGGNYPYHDAAAAGRAEFRDADNKPVDGADCLLFYTGTETLEHFDITDDIGAMTALNGGQPCWILSGGSSLVVPTFTRYDLAQDVYLDLGAPRQWGLPGVQYNPDATVYAMRWRSYIADRLDMSGKVLRCKVRLDGLQVGPELLRRFYWYGGSLWSLVKISNYSLTTFDPAECEFVQVRDKSNYLTGQY